MKLIKYLLVVAVILNVSCDPVGCDEGEGKFIECYKKDGSRDGEWCTELAIPPCECFSQDGKVSFLGEFKNKDQCRGDEQFKPPYARQPYDAGCTIFNATSLCVDFADNTLNSGSYFDYTEGSNDEHYRPLYVSFSISDEDYIEDDDTFYKIQVFNEQAGAPVATEYINENNVSLRKYDNSCEICPVTGVMKVDIKWLTEESTNPIAKLVREQGDENDPILTTLSEVPFRKFNEEVFTQSRQRIMNIAVAKTDEYNIEESYTDGGASFLSALSKAFGNDASNLRTVVNDAEVYPANLIDKKNSAAVLDVNFFGDLNTIDEFEMARARSSWSEEVYSHAFPEIEVNSGPRYINSVFTAEISFFGIYEIYSGTNIPPDMILSPETVKAKKPSGSHSSAFGVTYANTANYIVCLVYRLSDPLDYITPSIELVPTSGSLALATYIHELGHAWSLKGTDLDPFNPEDDCHGHTHKCSGKDKNICLWRTACVNARTEEYNELISAKATNPVFCERHRYIFSNGLTVLN